MEDDNPKTIEEWSASLKDENLDELDAKIKARSDQLEAERIEKLAKLEAMTPQILKLEQQKLLNERMDQQLKEVEDFEAKQADYQIITLKEIYDIEYPEEDWLIDKILLERGFSMIVGDTGTGKSFLSLYMAKCLITGEKFLDQFEVKTKAPVLIIDKENGLRRAKKRLQGLDCPGTDQIFFLKYPEKFSLEDTNFLTALHEMIIENNIKAVILDSFIDVILGEESDSVDTSAVYNAFRQISTEVSWWLLHHESKSLSNFTRKVVQRGRGSSNIAAQLDNQFYIETTKKIGIINFEQSKARDSEPLKKIGIEFINDDEGNLITFKYLGEVEEDASKIEVAKEAVLAALSVNNKLSRQELCGEVAGNIGRNSIDSACKELEADKIIRSFKEGRSKYYELLDTTYLPSSLNDDSDREGKYDQIDTTI